MVYNRALSPYKPDTSIILLSQTWGAFFDKKGHTDKELETCAESSYD